MGGRVVVIFKGAGWVDGNFEGGGTGRREFRSFMSWVLRAAGSFELDLRCAVQYNTPEQSGGSDA